MQRIDQSHLRLDQPHGARIPRPEIENLLLALQGNEIDLAGFAARAAQFPQLGARLVQAANSAAVGRHAEIQQPAHAAAYLGSRRIIELLRFLPRDMIADDEPVPAA